jgi:hypothetical protein
MNVLIALNRLDGDEHRRTNPETADHRIVTLDRHWVSQLGGVRVEGIVSTQLAPGSRIYGDALAYAEWRRDLLKGEQ